MRPRSAPFQGQPAALGDPDQAGPQRLRVDRLEDVVGRPLAQGGDRPLEVGVAGHDDDGRVGASGLSRGSSSLGGRVGEPAVEDDRRELRPVVAGAAPRRPWPPSRPGGRPAPGCRAGWPACRRRPRSPGCRAARHRDVITRGIAVSLPSRPRPARPGSRSRPGTSNGL